MQRRLAQESSVRHFTVLPWSLEPDLPISYEQKRVIGEGIEIQAILAKRVGSEEEHVIQAPHTPTIPSAPTHPKQIYSESEDDEVSPTEDRNQRKLFMPMEIDKVLLRILHLKFRSISSTKLFGRPVGIEIPSGAVVAPNCPPLYSEELFGILRQLPPQIKSSLARMELVWHLTAWDETSHSAWELGRWEVTMTDLKMSDRRLDPQGGVFYNDLGGHIPVPRPDLKLVTELTPRPITCKWYPTCIFTAPEVLHNQVCVPSSTIWTILSMILDTFGGSYEDFCHLVKVHPDTGLPPEFFEIMGFEEDLAQIFSEYLRPNLLMRPSVMPLLSLANKDASQNLYMAITELTTRIHGLKAEQVDESQKRVFGSPSKRVKIIDKRSDKQSERARSPPAAAITLFPDGNVLKQEKSPLDTFSAGQWFQNLSQGNQERVWNLSKGAASTMRNADKLLQMLSDGFFCPKFELALPKALSTECFAPMRGVVEPMTTVLMRLTHPDIKDEKKDDDFGISQENHDSTRINDKKRKRKHQDMTSASSNDEAPTPDHAMRNEGGEGGEALPTGKDTKRRKIDQDGKTESQSETIGDIIGWNSENALQTASIKDPVMRASYLHLKLASSYPRIMDFYYNGWITDSRYLPVLRVLLEEGSSMLTGIFQHTGLTGKAPTMKELGLQSDYQIKAARVLKDIVKELKASE